MSPHTVATSGSHTLRAVVADTKALRTILRNTALPILFMQEQTRMAGHNFTIFPNVHFILLSLLCFEARLRRCSLRFAAGFSSRPYFVLCSGGLKKIHYPMLR